MIVGFDIESSGGNWQVILRAQPGKRRAAVGSRQDGV
jgi:hypothetical protein